MSWFMKSWYYHKKTCPNKKEHTKNIYLFYVSYTEIKICLLFGLTNELQVILSYYTQKQNVMDE